MSKQYTAILRLLFFSSVNNEIGRNLCFPLFEGGYVTLIATLFKKLKRVLAWIEFQK